MEKAVFPLLIAFMFISQLLGFSSLDRKLRIGYALSGIIPLLIMIAIILTVPRESILRDEFSNSFTWLFPAMFGGQLLALPVLRKRAGNIFIKVNDVTQKNRRWVLLVLIPILFYLFLSTIPNRITYPGGESIYDLQFFSGRVPFWIFYLILIVVILIGVFAKAEFREQGILLANQFINWRDVESYSWYELDDQLRLSMKTKYKFGNYSTIYFVKDENQNAIEGLLKEKAIPRRDL